MEQRPKRKPTRLPKFDYSSPGVYFLTLCTKERQCILGRVLDRPTEADLPVLRLSPLGQLVSRQIQAMNDLYESVSVDHFVVMPNHVHLLLVVLNEGKASSAANATVPRFISTLKRFSNQQAGMDLWQRSYHDHVVRSERDYLRIWQYIDSNTEKWKTDCFYQADF